MTACVLALTALVAAGGLRVETGTPAALCPDIGEVRRAVRERLNVEGGGEWLASYDLVHRPEAQSGDVVRVELRDPAGRLRLRRDLPRSGESCVALAQAVALVLESFFRHPTEQPRRRRRRECTDPRSQRRRRRRARPRWAGGPRWTSSARGPTDRPVRRSPSMSGTGQGRRRPGPSVWRASGWRPSSGSPSTSRAPDRQPPPRAARCFVAGWRAACASRRRSRSCSGRSSCWGSIAFSRAPCPTGCPTSGRRRGRGPGPAAAAAGAAGRAVAGRRARFTPPALAGRFEIDGLPGELFPVPALRLFVGAGLSLVLFP